MKKTLYTAILAVIGLSLTSCDDFLDRKSTAYDSDGFYASEAGINDGVTAIYRLVPYEQNWKVPQAVMQDVYCPYALQADENVTISAGPGLTPDQSYVNSYWAGHWAIVARANNVLSGARISFEDLFDPNADCSDTYKRRYAEAIAVRDYAYYNLVQAFGDIPFFPELAPNEAYKNATRQDKKQTVDYLINELTQLGESNILPWTPEQLGRVGRGMVWNLIARFALFAGSHDLGGEGQAYFAIAADAAKKVMDNHGLAQNFGDLFTNAGQAKADVRKEILWEYCYANGGVRQTHVMRYGHTSRTAGGSSVRFPSVYTEVSFECIDGKRIDESPLYNPKKPFLNRDPRHHHTILMHGDTMWWDNGTKAIVLNVYGKTSQQYPDPFEPGQWYKYDNLDVTGTSYSFARNGVGLLWNKYNEDQTESFSESTVDLIIMRAAEAYLTYAEAKIEMNQLDNTVYDAINAVRKRAGMPEFDEARKGNQDKMRQIVRRERRVELAMEGVMLTDFRRWKIGDLLNSQPIYGQPVDKLPDGTTFRYTKIAKEHMPKFTTTERHDLNDIPDFSDVAQYYTARDLRRFWTDRFMWWPIPRTELDRCPNLTNPEGY